MSSQPESTIPLSIVPIESITYDEILNFCTLQREEDIDLEYKSDWPQDLDKLFCAFANTQGGFLLIGIEEEGKSRKPKCPPVGINGSKDAILQRIRNIAFDAIYPPINPEVSICEIPESMNKMVIYIRISPSRLMHSCDRRNRIYIRVADSSRGYELASIRDLEWLWSQRAKTDFLRENLLKMAIDHSNSAAIPWHFESNKALWDTQPLLSISIIPSFPNETPLLELRSLLEIVYSLNQVRLAWKHIDRPVPWKIGLWRSIPGAVCLSDRGNGSFLQYIEVGQLGHIFGAFSLEMRDIPASSDFKIQPNSKCHISYVLLAYCQGFLQYASQYFEAIKYQWPITISIRLYRANTAILYYKIPAFMDPLDLSWVSAPCPDGIIDLYSSEMAMRDLPKCQKEIMQQVVNSLMWAYGLGWDYEHSNEWFKNLIE